MITLPAAVVSLLSFRLRSRAALKIEVVALRHQLGVLRRQRPSRVRLLSADRFLWVWLYRIWPPSFNAIVLVNPETVVGGTAGASGSIGGGGGGGGGARDHATRDGRGSARRPVT